MASSIPISADYVRTKVRDALKAADRASLARWIERYNDDLERWHSVDCLIHTSEEIAEGIAEAYRLRGWNATVRKVQKTQSTYRLVISLD